MTDVFPRLLLFCAAPASGSASERIDSLLPVPTQIELMSASLRRFWDVINVDAIMDRGDLPSFVNVIKTDEAVDPNVMMYQAAKFFASYFEKYDFQSPVILADPDLLFFRDVHQVFDEDFDICVTKRGDSDMPYNSGIIFANNRNPQAVRHFFKLQCLIIEEKLMAHADWFADQFVLSEMMGGEVTKSDGRMVVVDGIRILVIPADVWNYSPPREHPFLLKRPACAVYHFKGRCRTFMPSFFKHFIARRRLNYFGMLRDYLLMEKIRTDSKVHFEADVKRVKPNAVRPRPE